MDDLDPRAPYPDPLEAGDHIHQTVEALVYDLSPDFVGPRLPDRVLLVDSFAAVLGVMDLAQLKTMRAAYRRMIVEGMAVVLMGGPPPVRDLNGLEELEIAYWGRTPTLIGLDDFYQVPAEAYDIRQQQAWPRAPRAFPARGRQAPRQSFRKIMRSVNRNR
jgi:hypothetical protein